MITDHTGRSKGFVFVEMETDQDALKAIQGLNE
jgi:RNA recognition motif-containing protein